MYSYTELETMGDPPEKQHKTSDELIEEFTTKRTWKYTLLVMSLMITWFGTPPSVYVTSFAGTDPVNNSASTEWWTCKSQKCRDMVALDAGISSKYPCDLLDVTEDNTTVMLLTSSDITWNLPRTSYSAEFDLYCDVQSRKFLKTLLSSIYFAGALTGLLSGLFIFDHIGRKRSAILGYFIAVAANVAGVVCHNYYFLLTIRFLQGVGIFLTATSLFILTAELLPSRYRNWVNVYAQCLWATGYLLTVAVGYLVKDWNFMFLTCGIIYAVLSVQVFFCIESPKYYLIQNDEKNARKSLESLAALTKTTWKIEDIELVDVSRASERQKASLRQQLIELCEHPRLGIETLLQMFLWFVIGMSYYGYNFGWGSIFSDVYLGYIMSMVGELTAYLLSGFVIAQIGRRRSMMVLFSLAIITFILPLAGSSTSTSQWNVESISSLFGIVFISSGFSLAYLWAAELAPTSHRGFVYCVSSSAARVGSFCGPFIFNNIKEDARIPAWVPVGIMGLLAVLCCVCAFCLVETAEEPTALTGQDVAERRKRHRYRL